MSFERPEPGVYIRKTDGAEVEVSGSTGIEWNDTVTTKVLGPGRHVMRHVRLENFWRKYEPKEDENR